MDDRRPCGLHSRTLKSSSRERDFSELPQEQNMIRTLVACIALSFASLAFAADKAWDKPPEMKIDVNKTYTATIDTTKGKIVLELFAKDAPKTVNSFVFLAREKFYDGLIFHRVIPNFMIQGGDPTGTGMGGPGYQFENE